MQKKTMPLLILSLLLTATVTSCADMVNSALGLTPEAALAVPAAPDNFNGTSTSGSSSRMVTLTWDSSSRAAGYKVYWYESSSHSYSYYKYASLLSATSATTVSTYITKDYEYHMFWVKAYNSTGESDYASDCIYFYY